MLAVSAGFLQAIKNKAPQDVRLEFTNGDVIGTSDVSITSGSLTFTEILNGETDVTFGRAVMSELSAVLINADGRFTDFDFSREFTAKIGVKVGNSFEYISLGVFKGERPEKVRGKLIDFAAHDRMSLFDKSAESFVDSLTFPCTLGEIFTKLCAFCGVGYVSAFFPNSGKTFDKNPLADTDYTCREILGYIAEAAGAYARMSRDGAVELVWFAEADYTVTRTDRFEMTESEFLTPPIDKLEVYNSYGDQLNTSGSGDIVYGISDNPFLYIENDTQLSGLQPYVDAIYNRITSLPAYHPSSFRAEFNPAVQCGDIISVVDDYGETIRFPVFVQTITWNGFGKTTYENTGGVIRQNAPFAQRELEQIKKKSVKTTDLWTYIDSYLSTEEGKASIETAVGGKFVTQDKLSGFVTETELNTSIKQYINGEEGTAAITSAVSGKFMAAPPSVSYSTPYGVTYGFTKTSDGYYTSTNAGVNSSYSYGVFTFNNSSGKAQEITLRCISYGESGFDFGIISTVNKNLVQSNATDTSYVLKSFEGTSSETPVDVTVSIPNGTSMITFKYIKNGSQHSGGDYFKIMPLTGEFVTVSEASSLIEQRVDALGASLKLSVFNGEKTSTISLTKDGVLLSSQTIQFNGQVVFQSDLSTVGGTTIDGANIKSGKISAKYIDVGELSTKKVIFSDDKYNFNVISSDILSENNARVTVGLTNYIKSADFGQYLNLYGTQIYMIHTGYDLAAGDSDSYSLKFDMANRRIISGSSSWSIGYFENSDDNDSFGDAYFDYLYADRIYCGGRICMGELGETYPSLRYYGGELRWYTDSSEYTTLA